MKYSFKKLALLFLVSVMALSLAACGSSAPSSPAVSPESVASSAQASPAAQETAAPEFIYQASFSSVAAANAVNLRGRVYASDRFFASGSDIIGSIAPEGVKPDYFGQYDITQPQIYAISYDGKISALENYESILVTEAPEGTFSFSSDTYINSLSSSSKGNLITFEAVYCYWNDIDGIDWNSDDYMAHHHYSQTFYIRELDQTGKELQRCTLECPLSESLYSNGILDPDDNLLIVRSTESGSYSLLAIRLDGETAYEIPVEDVISNTAQDSAGTVYLTLWGNGMQMVSVDFSAGTVSEPTPLPSDAYTIYTGGGDFPLYYSSGVYFYGLDPATGESTRLFNWLDCDINPDSLESIHITADGTIIAFVNEFDTADMEYAYYIAHITKQPYDPSAKKTELTFATQYLASSTRYAIINFNRKSSSCRIVVKDYSEYNTEEDYSAGLTKLTTEIMAGNCPDLIDLNGIPVAQLASKGLLEDLYPYLDADPELKRDDFFANVLSAAEKDGKLVSTVSSFTLNTAVGASAVVGEEPGWTYSDLNAALKDMPDGCTAFDISATRDAVLSDCLSLDMGQFVNWSTGEVSFTQDEFVAMLEFANRFPASYNWDEYNFATDSPEARIATGEQMLYSTTISSMNGLMFIETCFHGMPVTFIGLPTVSGTGNTLSVDTGYAMSASCSSKEEAWQFLRTFFTEKYYKNAVYYGLPIQKSLFARELKDVTTVKYAIDNYGNYKLDANGKKIPEEHYYAIGSNVYTSYALSSAIAEQFETLVNTTTKTPIVDESISGIVKELAAAYFDGQKSAEETARLIQSKANIYVNEQR